MNKKPRCRQLLTNLFRFFSLVVAISLVANCGWHLAGTQPNLKTKGTIASIYLVRETSDRSFHLALEEEFAAQNVKITSDSEIKLTIAKLRTERRPYAYSSTGNPVQYQLEVNVDYSFQPKDNRRVPEVRTITSRRQYDFQASAVIAKKQEEDMLLFEMHREIARRLIALARQDN